MDMGKFYSSNQNPLSKELVTAVIREMVPSFLAEVKGSGNVHQAVTRKNGKLYVHLINTNGPHNNPSVLVYDDVPFIKNIEIQVSLDKQPSSVILQPGNLSVTPLYTNGRLSVKISELKIYSILEITE